MTVLAFIFAGFWHFMGTVVLIGVTLEGTADIIRAIKGVWPFEPKSLS